MAWGSGGVGVGGLEGGPEGKRRFWAWEMGGGFW
jgi:hypothetical protein